MFLIGDWHSGSFATAGMEPGKDFKSFLMPSVTPDVPQSIIVEASPIVVSKAALAANPDLGKAISAMMQPDASNMLGKTVQVYNGNLKGTPPNAIVEADNQLVAEQKPRQLVRWWEAVPPQIQGDLVAQMGSFMLNPSAENGEKVMDQMQQINSDYWANQ
jgi:multiple sugar transport system substrate-binding protein